MKKEQHCKDSLLSSHSTTLEYLKLRKTSRIVIGGMDIRYAPAACRPSPIRIRYCAHL